MINTVVISSDDDIQLLRGVESYKGKNSFLLQSKSIEKDVFDQNPTVEEVKVTIQLPDVLKMVITTAEPVASLSATQGYVVLNKKGRILEKIKSNEQRKQAIPPIRFFQKLNYDEYNTGSFVEYKDIKTALYLIAKLQELDQKVDSIDIDGANVIRFHIENKSVIFSGNKSLSVQEYELERLIQEFKIRGKEFEKIDLRFNKPVIIFKT